MLKFFKKLSRKKTKQALQPVIIPRDQHHLSRKKISQNALKVLYRLQSEGYDAYLVGGCVRDILLDLTPKDFDVVTNATPEQIKHCFRNCRLIGRRFRLAHIFFGRDIIEVATYRSLHDPETSKPRSESKQGMVLRDNSYGTIDQDAARRDFSINALYYNINDFSIVDYMGGLDDIESKTLRILGDPITRYREDPVRMLRAIRFSVKVGFDIDHHTAQAIYSQGNLLASISPSRLFDESLKLFMNGHALANYKKLREFQLFRYLFPQTHQALIGNNHDKTEKMIELMFENTDHRINIGKPVTPAFIMAALLWAPYLQQKQSYLASGMHKGDASYSAMEKVLKQQQQSTSVPKRFTMTTRDIWRLQYRLPKRIGKQAFVLLEHPKFRAAYDFLLLRHESGEHLDTLTQWWTEFQEVDEEQQKSMVQKIPRHHKRPKKKNG